MIHNQRPPVLIHHLAGVLGVVLPITEPILEVRGLLLLAHSFLITISDIPFRNSLYRLAFLYIVYNACLFTHYCVLGHCLGTTTQILMRTPQDIAQFIITQLNVDTCFTKHVNEVLFYPLPCP